MDFGVFLEKLDTSSLNAAKALFEDKDALEGWDKIDPEYKAAIVATGVSSPTWAYQPANRKLVIVEHSPESWSVFSFNTVTESKKVEGRGLNESDRYSDFGDEFGGELKKGSKMSSKSVASSGVVASPVVDKGDFKTCLLECVDIVKNQLFME